MTVSKSRHECPKADASRFGCECRELAGRIHIPQIREYCNRLKHDALLFDELFCRLEDEDRRTACNAAWIFTHLDNATSLHLSARYDELSGIAMQTDDPTLRRLLLTLIFRLPVPEPLHIGLFDFCLREMLSCRQPHGVRCLCMKIAGRASARHPELHEELRQTLEIMEPDLLPPSMRSAQRSTLRLLEKYRKALKR